MKQIQLNTDAKMPIIGLGTWQANPGEVYQAIRWAIKLGYTHFDCAAIYGNEAEIGQAFHDAIKEDGIKRSDLFITSKLWNDSHEPQEVRPALEKTLKDLQLDYLDLYLIHWPVAQKKGSKLPQQPADFIPLSQAPLESTWAEMEKLYREGLVKAIGVSNFNIAKLKDLIEKSEVIPAVNQVENHPWLQQPELFEFCTKNQIALTAYSPLGSARHEDGKSLLDDEELKAMANRLQVTPAQLVLAWQMQRGVIVIPKSVHENRLRENFASQNVTLDEADMKAIAAMDKGYRFINGELFVNPDAGYREIWE